MGPDAESDRDGRNHSSGDATDRPQKPRPDQATKDAPGVWSRVVVFVLLITVA